MKISDERGKVYGVYCGGYQGMWSVVVDGVHALLTFHSDNNGIQKRGFMILYKPVEIGKLCDKITFYFATEVC